MAKTLTKQDILDLLEKQAKDFDSRLEKEAKERLMSQKAFEKQSKDFDSRMKKEAKERLMSQKAFDKKIGELTGTLGKFVEGLVEPKLVELFQAKGIEISEIYKNIIIKKEGREETEIDILLINSDYSVAVEVKTTLTVEGVNEHLERLDKLQKNPIRSIQGTILLGAVAGIRVEEEADKYAYRKGLFVLKQKGEIVEISNDAKFKPREWNIKKIMKNL